MSDESKRLPYGLIAATVILVGTYVGMRFFAPDYFNRPAGVERAGGDAVTQAPADTAAAAGARGLSAAERRARAERQETVTIETDAFAATFSDLNTGLVGLRLAGHRYRTESGRGYDVVTTEREEYFPFQVELEGLSIPDDAVWQAEQLSKTAVRFRYEGDGFVVTRKIEAGRGPYQLWSTVTVQNRGGAPREIGLRKTVHHYVTREAEEEGVSFLGSRALAISRGICVSADDEVREPRNELEEPQGLRGGVRFAGVENTYFTLLMAPASAAAESCSLRAEDRPNAEAPQGALFEAALELPKRSVESGASTTFRTLAYAGPKDIDALQAAGHGMTEVVDLGWFGFLARGLIKLLRFVYDHVGNWGVAIILLTFLVKLLLYPLTEKSFQSMAKMRVLKPEMDRINELYGDDREKKGAAIMELYKKHQINPLAGCLPSLLQMPVWIALYQSLSTNIELYHAPFVGYWQDLSSPDQYFVLPLVVGGLMFVQQRMTPSTMDPVQAKIMLYMMPTMITAFMLFLPAGLCLYMVTNSTLGIAQQRWIQWRLDRASATGPGPSEPGPSGGEADSHEPGSTGSSSVVSTRRAAGGKKRSQRGRA